MPIHSPGYDFIQFYSNSFLYQPVLWIQIHWIWIRIQDFGPIWIRIQDFGPIWIWIWIRIQVRIWIWTYAINFKIKIILEKTIFFTKLYRYLLRTKCHIIKFLVNWVIEMIYILNLTPFVSILSFFYMCGSGSVFWIRIRIHKAPEYGSNMDPDPQQWY